MQDKVNASVKQGNLDALVITGFTQGKGATSSNKQVRELIQNFVDMSGDVQTAAYVSSYASCTVLLSQQ
jgi:hypothetical protein